MAKITPSQRTKRLLIAEDYRVEKVERWVPAGRQGGFRRDLLGFIDFLALKPDEPILAVQSCGKDFAGHMRKIRGLHHSLALWLSTGSQFVLIGWRPLKDGYAPRFCHYRIENGVPVDNLSENLYL